MVKFLFLIIIIITFSACEKVVFKEKDYASSVNTFDVFWNEVDRNYSFFPYINLNWDSVYTVYRPKIHNSMGDAELFRILSEMANLLKDGHVNLFSTYGVSIYSKWYSAYPLNKISLTRYLENSHTASKVMYYAKIKNHNIGYIAVSSFSSPNQDYIVIDEVLQFFKNTDGIIIDVRSNGGGNSANADTLASRFADAVHYDFRSRYRNGPGHDDFTEWYNYSLKPAGPERYLKPTVIVTNRLCFSATEGFIAEMMELPNVKIVGDTTGGGSGNPLQRQLPNGWTLRLSNSQRQLPDGTDYQYKGIIPDIPVWISKNDSVNSIDRILEKAILEVENPE